MGSLQSSVAMYKAQSNTDPIKLPGNTHPPHRFHGLPGTTQFSYFHHVSFCTGSMEIRTWKLRRQSTFWQRCTMPFQPHRGSCQPPGPPGSGAAELFHMGVSPPVSPNPLLRRGAPTPHFCCPLQQNPLSKPHPTSGL